MVGVEGSLSLCEVEIFSGDGGTFHYPEKKTGYFKKTRSLLKQCTAKQNICCRIKMLLFSFWLMARDNMIVRF